FVPITLGNRSTSLSLPDSGTGLLRSEPPAGIQTFNSPCKIPPTQVCIQLVGLKSSAPSPGERMTSGNVQAPRRYSLVNQLRPSNVTSLVPSGAHFRTWSIRLALSDNGLAISWAC